MSDALARLLTAGLEERNKQPKNHDERLIEALEKALAVTTIHKPGVPWEYEDEGKENGRGYFLPGSDE